MWLVQKGSRMFSSFNHLSFVCSLVLACIAVNGQQTQAAEKPNIVVCMTDDQGWGDVSYNGHKVLKTPVLDEMAKSGIRFDRFYAAAPVCSPTRGSVMTGRNSNRFGCFLYNMSIRPRRSDAGRDAQVGRLHYGAFRQMASGARQSGQPNQPIAKRFYALCFAR